MKKKILILCLCLCVTAFFAACGNKVEKDNSGRTDVVVAMTTGSEPETGFDPIMGWGSGDHVHEPLIQSTLITTDTDMNFVNDLATDYSLSADGLTYTFTLRDDVSFTNGDKLTAADVAFTFNKIKETEGTAIDMSCFDKAVAVDDTTVELKLKERNNTFLYSVAVVGIVPKDAYGENYAEEPIGSGRYILEQWNKGEQVIFTANPDYYGEAPQIDKVTVLFMEEDAALAAIQTGEVDIAYTSAVYADTSVDGYSLVGYDSVDSRGISLPTNPAGGTKADGDAEYSAGNDVLCDINVRKAISYGLDRDILTENTLAGYGTPAFSVCDGMPWASDNIAVTTDVAKAEALLKDAGWQDTDNDGVLEKDGVKCAFDLYYSAGDSVRQAMAAEFTNQMAALGIEVNVIGESWDVIYQHEYSDAVLWGWGSNSPLEVYNLLYSSAWGNYADYNNEEVDAELDTAMTCADLEEAYGHFAKAMELTATENACTWVWLANIDHLYFSADGLQVAAQKIHPHGHGWSLINNVDQWSWQ